MSEPEPVQEQCRDCLAPAHSGPCEDHEPAPAAPPEGEAEAILRRKEVRQPCSGKRGDGPWVLVEPAIYLSVTERDTVLAALAAATARAAGDEAGRLRWEQEAERLRRERADLQHKLAHWQRVAEESGTMAARRVEAMLRYAIACLTEPDDDRKAVYDQILAGFRALPATPAPGPSAEAEDIRAQCLLPVISAKHEAEAKGFESDAAYLDAIIRQIRAIPLGDVQPGPSAEGPGTVRCGRCGEAFNLLASHECVGAVERRGLMAAIAGELDHAYRKHGRDPWGRHEFFAILLEEVDELKDAIWKDAPQEEVLAELRQVAAMCFRYVETGDRYRGAHPTVPSRAPDTPNSQETR